MLSNSMSNVIPPEFRPMFRYDKQWQMLICCPCHTVIPNAKRSLVQHLHNQHGSKFKEYKLFIQAMLSMPCHSTKDQFPQLLQNLTSCLYLPIGLLLKKGKKAI